MTCIFCEIAARRVPAEIVWRGDGCLAFLDNRPLFPGHVLLVPDTHVATFAGLPADRIAAFFTAAQRIERAVEALPGAEGSFLAINNVVSQSVPHLHLHIVPRRKGDGLKGFFWPRRDYEGEEHMRAMGQLLRDALAATGG